VKLGQRRKKGGKWWQKSLQGKRNHMREKIHIGVPASKYMSLTKKKDGTKTKKKGGHDWSRNNLNMKEGRKLHGG